MKTGCCQEEVLFLQLFEQSFSFNTECNAFHEPGQGFAWVAGAQELKQSLDLLKQLGARMSACRRRYRNHTQGA